jgi:hypothetical protein
MKKQGCYLNQEALKMAVDNAVISMNPGWSETAAILILANVGATTESPPHLKFLSLQAKMRIAGETTVKIDNTSGSYYNRLKTKTRR